MSVAPTFVLLVVTEPSARPTVYGGTFSIFQHAPFPAEVMQYLFKTFTAPSVRTDLVDPVSGMAPMKAFPMSAPRVSGPSGVAVLELLLGEAFGGNWMIWLLCSIVSSAVWLLSEPKGQGAFPSAIS